MRSLARRPLEPQRLVLREVVPRVFRGHARPGTQGCWRHRSPVAVKAAVAAEAGRVRLVRGEGLLRPCAHAPTRTCAHANLSAFRKYLFCV